MIGYKKNPGIVPIISEEIFYHIRDTKNEKISFEVNFSMLEIYNEKVQDLLISIEKWPVGGLKVWENK